MRSRVGYVSSGKHIHGQTHLIIGRSIERSRQLDVGRVAAGLDCLHDLEVALVPDVRHPAAVFARKRCVAREPALEVAHDLRAGGKTGGIDREIPVG